MPRYKLTVAYEGTDFHGWQKQEPPGEAPLRTVQGVLEDAVRLVVREPVNVIGASRTDSGVHAFGQVAAFSTSRPFPVPKLPAAVSSRLPDDAQVTDAAEVPEIFSPISDCEAKGYRYAIAFSGEKHPRPPLFDRRTIAFTPYALDVDRMNDAARRFVGRHDFSSFTRRQHGRESTVRTVFDCTVSPVGERRCHVDVSGDGFLYNMVRIIAGTLLEVGRGRLEPEAMEEVIAARDRAAAGPTMPPEGLFLMWARYRAGTESLDSTS